MSASHAHRHPAYPAYPAAAAQVDPTRPALTRRAFLATLHGLVGCASGEMIGLAAGRSLGWGDGATIAVAVALAIAFGDAVAMVSLHRRGMRWMPAARLTLAADTTSLAVLALVANAVLLLVPGAMDARVAAPLFWGAMGFALLVALLVAWPVNRWLIARGDGPAWAHEHRHGHTAQ